MTYPRVTEILKPFTSYDKVPKDVLANAARRGTAVHALCAGIAANRWVPDSMIDAEYLPYINSFNLWKNAQVKDFTVIEKRYCDEEMGFTGQLDFVVTGNDGRVYLVDLKTSAAPQKTYRVQMAAYDHLLRRDGINVDAAMIVYINKQGQFPNIDLIDTMGEHWNAFYCALECYKYFNKGKRNGRKTA